MKKSIKFLKTGIFLSMAALTLSGCGKGGKEPAKEYVYVPEYHTMETDSESAYFQNPVVSGDYMYMSAHVYDEEKETSTQYIYKYSIPDNTNESILFDWGGENTYIDRMTVGSDGNLLLLVSSTTYEMSEDGEVTDYSSAYSLCTLSPEDLSVLNTLDITEMMEEINYIRELCIDKEGRLYVCGGDESIRVYDPQMKFLFQVPMSDNSWVSSMAVSREGIVYAAVYGGENGAELKPIDINAKALGEAVPNISGWGNLAFFTGQSTSLLLSTNDKVSKVDPEAGTVEELFSWLDVDIDGSNIRQVGELADGRIWTMTQSWNSKGNSSNELVYISRKKASEVEPKVELVYGTLYLDYQLRGTIIDFNKANPRYRIVVKAYGENDDGTRSEDGITQLNAAITSGNGPDIIDLSAISFSQYAAKGVLEDLYPYMEKSGIDRNDYLENILRAYEVDGKLYGVMGQFNISTTMAKTAKVGDVTGWTLAEMLDFAEANPTENIFQYGTRSSIFAYCVYYNIDEFIDWGSGQCNFDSPDFIRVMEFAAQFPEEYDYAMAREGTASQLHSDKILLMQSSVDSVQEFQMYRGLFGEPISFVGYPNSAREGNLINPRGGCMGISSRSKNKDGAWEFVSQLLSEEYQNDLVSEWGGGIMGFPVSKAALEKQFENDMTPNYYEDENGNQVENMKTSWGYDDFNIDIYAATEEEVGAVRTLIESAARVYGSVDQQLISIITEEAEPFFSGQKSAAEAAGVIQNRLRTYVNENR